MVTAVVGIAFLVIGIFGAYLIYQESAERDYVKEANKLLSDRNQIVNEFMSDLLPKMETKQISVTQAEFRVSSLVNDAEKLHRYALGMSVPDKYRTAHTHLIQGLDYFTSAVKSANTALQYIENALQAGQQLQISSNSVIGAIFGFGSLPNLSGMSDVHSNTEAAEAAFNDAVRYLKQSEESLATFSSAAHLENNASFSSTVFERGASSAATQEQLEACKKLGIPAFSCSEEQILAKKKLNAEDQGAHGSGTKP